jgi:2',3'-cyclic-nucleotide 2'-phosphodiesterase (5'-nucleotidase family)
MSKNKTRRALTVLVTLVILFSLFSSALAAPSAAPAVDVTFTILHTNDFHGQLVPSNTDPTKASNPGLARVAAVVDAIRTAKGADNVLLVDSGDEMQGSLLSNLGDGTPTGKGIPTIDAFNTMGYDMATFGNHEFDWGQTVLAARTTQATYPFVTANIVKKDTGDCATSGWTKPDFADNPYELLAVGTAPNTVNVAFIGVTTTETPTITVATATAGLCFKDPADSILHYYDAMKAAGADVIVVLSHLGLNDGGYGYGLPVYGDKSLAQKLIDAGKPANLIIGGHSHTNMIPPATVVGSTTITQAYYNGRNVGEADITVSNTGAVSVDWKTIAWKIPNPTSTPPSTLFGWKLYTSATPADFLDATIDTSIDALITGYATNPAYLAIVNEPVGYSAVDLPRKDSGNSDNMMGTFIDDAILNYLNTDAYPANDIDIFFNNAGGIRADWCYVDGVWVNTGCVAGTHSAGLLTYGNMFTVLPFGNATVVGQMTGAQILQVLHYGPNVAGVIQPAGLKYSYFKYVDANPGPQPYAWGAYDVCVVNKTTHACDPLDLTRTYKVGTNEFLAPAGGDGYNAFKYMTNITYWGDMLNAVNAYVTATYGTAGTAYKGPNGDGTLDGRITLNGDGDTTYDTGEIVPLTILHHNDSHGNLAKGAYVGYTQFATLIKQERLHNPDRTLLLNAGDSIQGDAMMYYFKDAGAGYASDGTVLPPSLQINPFIALVNSMNYTAMTLGNHEFNFGSKVFVDTFTQASFPILGANVTDSGLYGINKVVSDTDMAAVSAVVNVRDSLSLVLPSGNAVPIKVAILGITNHRVPNYELPSNIPGLTFSDPILKATELVPDLRANNDVVIALTHIGFTENPSSVEVDTNVDTNLAATVNGIDAIIGGHSHTDPSKQTAYSGVYKFLPTILASPDGKPDLITQAYRYNNTLGEVVIGLRSNGSGGYDVVSQTGRYLSVTMDTVEDAATKAIVDPYVAALATYNNTVIGQTTVPLDALQAFTQETNGANLQADAAVYELQTLHAIPVDFHLSGAMTNKAVATTGPYPVTLKISDMFTLMPYENSLVVISMNGPQLKTVLERAYRNYYYYKYVSGYGGYSYYTTCMLDTNAGNQIKYNDVSWDLPNGNNVISLTIGGVPVDFNNATKYYNVSTVNYLAAGSCNFNDAGVTLWPLSQIVADTQYYVRDAVIDYITHMGTVSPAIEGRLRFVNLSLFQYFLPSIMKP